MNDYSDLDALIKNQAKGPSIKAIPVNFKGFRLRSRLEGRWAVFFDSIGIAWQYERQGFKLSNGVCYLPDFYLPHINTFAEAKPADPTSEERQKCELTVMGLGGLFLFLAGVPDFRAYTGVSCDAGMLTEATYSLDIHASHKAYFEERRLWAFPEDAALTEEGCSNLYREAVYDSRAERFDGKGA